MNDLVFVDTGAWFASIVPWDANHERAVHWLANNTRTLLTTDSVFSETLTLLRIRVERERAMWLAGGGTKGGTVYGETDDFSYNIVKDPVHVRDFHATVLHLLGYDHQRFTYSHQGLENRLTGVEPAKVISELLA